MPLGHLWAGNAYGTNRGNVFVKLEGDDNALKGSLHFNEPGVAVVVYQIVGKFDGIRLEIEGKPQAEIEGLAQGRLKANATLQPNGNLSGEWQTEIGTAGTFVLFPHDQSHIPPGMTEPDQVHTARHSFGPIEIDRQQIIALADGLQREFTKGKVVVTIAAGTEQSRYLEDFKQLSPNEARAELAKLFVREPDTKGFDKSITVEFGQTVNFALAQGVSESWVLGEREKLKRDIQKFERHYATKAVGVGINQFLLVCTIIFLPSLPGLVDRSILVIGVLALVYGVNWLHSRYLPHAAIYLDKRKEGWLARILPSVISWVIGIAASVIAGLLGAYLKGWLALP